MHTTRWGLEKPPFPSGNAEPVFFTGIPQQEALARLRFLVHNQRRMGLVLGETGCGKTLLFELFAEECRRESWSYVAINLSGLTLQEFQWQLAVQLQAGARSGDDSLALARRLESRLRQSQLQMEQMVWLLDDADHAGPDVLTQLVRFAQLPASRVGSLTLVLAAKTKQAGRIGERLSDLVDLRIDLEPWDAEDTTGFLQLALVAAGADEPLFDDSALDEIHRLTGGVPRLVNRLADYALVAGAGGGLEQIDAETVAAAWEGIGNR